MIIESCDLLKLDQLGVVLVHAINLLLFGFQVFQYLEIVHFIFTYLYTLCTILSVVIKLNKNVTYQKVFGFGGAMTDAAGINIASLSSGTADNLIKAYYSHDG